MGVTGLWKLIEPCGKPVPVETLEGKILAIDISIWLHQVVKGFQDSKGSALNNAHLLGLFHRLCKLLYYRVRPVFIFDGGVPQLKRDTIARRQQQRSKVSNEADRIQALLLQSLAKEKVVQQALGTNAELLLKSPGKRPVVGKSNKSDEDDIFKLPELPPSAIDELDEKRESDNHNYDEATTSDSSYEESTLRRAYDASLQAIDVRSQHFKNLPADVRHEILTDIKETRKQSSWGRLHELPARSDEFCSFQMKRLLRRRAVQESLEQAEKEMGGRTLTYAELCNFFTEEGIVTPTAITQNTRQISSDEHTRFLLVRDLKKKTMAAEDHQKQTSTITSTSIIKQENESIVHDELPCTSSKAIKNTAKELVKIEPDDKCNADTDLALSLFLDESKKVYDEKDYEYDSDQDLRLNREQSKNLRNSAKGPARSYMIEYGGMNDAELDNIMEASQLNDTKNLDLLHDLNNTNISENDIASNSIEEAKQLALAIELSQKDQSKSNNSSDQIKPIDSDTDSDLEEVTDAQPMPAKCCLQICVNIKDELDKESDLFDDIFEKPDQEININWVETKGSESIEQINVDEAKENKIKSQDETTFTVKNSRESTQENQAAFQSNVKQAEISKKDITLSATNSFIDNQSTEVKNVKLKKEVPTMSHDSILDELKRQTKEVQNIKLDSIQLKNSMVIELSSDDEVSKPGACDISHEVIELCHDANETNRASSNKTPSKSKAITDFFETTYKIKRTPDKQKDANVTPPLSPMAPKPFFVKRTPKSGRKRNVEKESSDDDVSPNKKSCKASKTLFEANETPKELNSEDIQKEAVDILKAQNTTEQLQAMAANLADERRELESERNRQDRMGTSISQRMSADCQDLLRLFGVPYIVAPMEAEAQCAFLNAIGITHGTITDDSDIWLFGGRTVYKNFFAQNKHVVEFRAEQIEQTFNCNRGKLIQLACLVGSDYTTGIHGIGAVTALEILASFSNTSTTSSETPSSINHSLSSVMSTLEKFKEWWQAHKNTNSPIGSSARLSLLKKLKNIALHEGFPSSAVVNAYLTPKVDENRSAFSWGSPDIESIREFSRKFFGWTTSKTDEILMPVIKKINEKKIQGSIRNYFTTKSELRVQQPKVSKRVQSAIDKLSGKTDEETAEKSKRRTRHTRKKKSMIEANEANLREEKEDNQATLPKRIRRKAQASTTDISEETPGTSRRGTIETKIVDTNNATELIPQRQRDLERMQENKAKAAAILKASSKPTK